MRIEDKEKPAYLLGYAYGSLAKATGAKDGWRRKVSPAMIDGLRLPSLPIMGFW
jgi:hypothetical protein